MPLGPGVRLGPYEVIAAIGAGGMGEVYRARDAKLNRDVALKILPPAFAADPDRLARFHREAQVLASLNHPHIAAIYGFEDSGETHALVLEFVDGPTLADRIAQGALPIDEALAIAAQIAEALEAAHEQGIIHRDLKPANIKVKPDGSVKVLDFGLAKLADVGAGFSRPDISLSPTITSPLVTGVGVLLGTAAYMSPEQAKGHAADKRSDIWAFGCILYEMLTGRRAFEGEGVSDTLAAILRGEPDWNALPTGISPIIERLLRRCLRRHHKDRIPDIAVARFDISDALTSPVISSAGPAPTGRSTARTPPWFAWTVAGVALVTAGVTSALVYLRVAPAPPEMRLEVMTPATTDPTSFALSPDGRRLVFMAAPDGKPSLWLRPLDSRTAQPLPGTDGALAPFWSPDGRSIGFFADNKLKRLDLGGGLPQTLTDAAARGGSWNRDGVILFARTTTGPLFRIPAAGGEPSAATKLPTGTNHQFPAFLPDGRRFVFGALGPPSTAGIYLASLDSDTTTRLTGVAGSAQYIPTGWLLFLRQATTLVAQRLDVARSTLVGDAVNVADPVAAVGNAAVYASGFSVSTTGLIAYRSAVVARRQLVWFDRTGKVLNTFGPVDESGLSAPKLSPDDRRVAVARAQQGNADIWLQDGMRSVRFTFDPAAEAFPLWSPDGREILFDSNRKGQRDLYRKPASGGGMEELLFESPQNKAINDWSADGRFILFLSNDPQKTARDLWVLPMTGDRKPYPFLKTNFDEWRGRFSPDGRWVAYQSNESGRHEIYVRPFPGPGGQWQISTAGGISPTWSRNGAELYYVAPDAKLMAAPIHATGSTLEPGTPVALFQTRMVGGGSELSQGYQYDVSRDGRFLINVTADEGNTSPITVILNWAGLKP